MVLYFACKIKQKRGEKRIFAHRIREIFLYIERQILNNYDKMAILPYRESKNTLNIPCAGAAEGSCQSLFPESGRR